MALMFILGVKCFIGLHLRLNFESSQSQSQTGKTRIVPKNQRKNLSCKIFTSSVASASKKFENRPKIPSMPDVFIRPASQVCQRIKPSISRICTSHFKNFNPRVLQQKTSIAFLLYCFQFNYTLVVTFTTNDRQVSHGFVY